MIVLVPISKFRVVYEVAEGQPYSHLERLVLKAVASGVCSMSKLTRTFEIHPRLLIESLVTLTHAGWIALGRSPDEQFVATPEGRKAASEGQVPDSVVISRRTAFVLLERVTGTVMPDGEVRYVPKKLLEREGIWDSCLRLRSEIFENVLDEGQVQQFLPRDQGQRLHWVGPIEMVTKGGHYIPASVEENGNLVHNLPVRSGTYLREVVLGRARAEAAKHYTETEADINWEELFGKARPSPVSLEETWDCAAIWEDDVRLLGNDRSHVDILFEALAGARKYFVVLSESVNSSSLERLRASIIDALVRGVDVDILWGRSGEKDVLEWMKRLTYEAKQKEFPGRIRFNREPSGCRGNVVIWDDSSCGFLAAVSSGAWLGPLGPDVVRIGLVIRPSEIIADLCWYISGLWSSVRSEALSSVPDRWRRVASALEGDRRNREIGASQDVVRIRLLREQENRNITDAVGAPLRFLAGSVIYDGTGEAQTHWTAGNPAETRHLPGLVGGAAVSDTAFCITSADLLGRPRLGDDRGRDLGFLIKGQKAASEVLEILESSLGRDGGHGGQKTNGGKETPEHLE